MAINENTPWWTRVCPRLSLTAAVERLCARGLAVQFSECKSGDLVCDILGKALWQGKSGPSEQDATDAMERAVWNMQTDLNTHSDGDVTMRTTRTEDAVEGSLPCDASLAAAVEEGVKDVLDGRVSTLRSGQSLGELL